MAKKPENTFRESIHRHLPKTLHHEKMANPYSSGTADDWYSGNKADVWIEYKYLATTPSRKVIHPANSKMLSPLQLRWLQNRYKEGRNVWVIIGCPNGGVIFSGLELETQMSAESFRERLCSRKELASWIMGQTMK